MVVPLHYQLHLPRLLEDVPYLCGVLHDVRLLFGVELVVDDRHTRALRRRKLGLQELHLLRWDERVRPREIAATVWFSVRTIACVEHDEADAVAREGIEGLRRVLALVGDLGEKLLLREIVVVVVAENVVARPLEGGEACLDRA